MPRFLDFLIAALLAVLTLPLVGVLLILVWIDTRTMPLFAQYRVGRDERPFLMFKIRTMQLGTLQAPTHSVGTSAITRSGAFLRRYKLDELPQLWNVVVGHMALVGPRPCLPSQKELIQARRQGDVFSVRPGITGQAQVAGVDMSALDRIVQEDTDYVRRRNLSSDIRLLRLTFDGLTRQAPVKT